MFIDSLKFGPENFDFKDEGSMDKYLGVDIEKLPDNTGFTMTQPFFIDRILMKAQIDLTMTNEWTTPVVYLPLSPSESGPENKHDWKYRT